MLTSRLTPGLESYGVMIAAGLVLPIVAVLSFLAIALHLVTPFGLVRRRQA
jgi:hypothetical protein